MEEPDVIAIETEPTFWAGHRFLLLVAISIAIALTLVIVSMGLYASSGAAQLDLSRPGYRSVSSQAVKSDNSFAGYADSGPVNQDSINQFKELYSKQVQLVKTVDAFSGDPLNPVALEISAPAQ